MSKHDTMYELSLMVLKLTEKGCLVTEGLTEPDTGKPINHWLPRSQIKGDLEEGKMCELQVPEWLVNEKGLTV